MIDITEIETEKMYKEGQTIAIQQASINIYCIEALFENSVLKKRINHDRANCLAQEVNFEYIKFKKGMEKNKKPPPVENEYSNSTIFQETFDSRREFNRSSQNNSNMNSHTNFYSKFGARKDKNQPNKPRLLSRSENMNKYLNSHVQNRRYAD